MTIFHLIRLLEEWRLQLDKSYLVEAVITDLSKTFDCIPHDLLFAKLEAYGFDNYTIRYVSPYSWVIYGSLVTTKSSVRFLNGFITLG